MKISLRGSMACFVVMFGLCLAPSASMAAPSLAGVNLPWLGYGHTFDVDGLHGYGSSYNASTVQSVMDDLKSKHLTVCRVMLFDDLEGVVSGGNLNTIITPSSTYVTNWTDFVNRANADGVTVYATLFNTWDFVSWPSTFRMSPYTIFNNSALYASNGPIQTVSRAVAGKKVIWDFMNEGNNMAQYYSGGWKDLVGWSTMNTWISNARSAIRAGGSTGMFTISDNDPNVLTYNTGTSNSADLLNVNNLDFFDCHFYDDNGSLGFSSATLGAGKPVFTGEFGPGNQDWATTGDNKTTLVDNFWSSASSDGLQGLLMWAYLDDGSGNACQGTAQLSELSKLAGGTTGGGTTGGGTTGGSVPSTPSGLAASAGNGQVSLSWSASSGATSYNVYRSTSSGGEGTTPTKSGITSTSYTDTGLTNGTKYYYKVAAVNSVGTSGQSSEVSATPASGGGGSGPLTFTGTAPTNQQWYTQEELAVGVPAGTTVSACTVTITDKLVSGDTYGNMWTNGGSWSTSHGTGSSTITYTFTLGSGATLSNGQQWWAQVDSNQQQPVSSDTYVVTYTANGTQYTASGVF